MKKIFLFLFVAVLTASEASAQFKLGKAIGAGAKVLKAATLSNQLQILRFILHCRNVPTM